MSHPSELVKIIEETIKKICRQIDGQVILFQEQELDGKKGFAIKALDLNLQQMLNNEMAPLQNMTMELCKAWEQRFADTQKAEKDNAVA